ncbi:hypothetical protein EJB05_07957, partial [Eragrostis curvula]
MGQTSDHALSLWAPDECDAAVAGRIGTGPVRLVSSSLACSVASHWKVQRADVALSASAPYGDIYGYGYAPYGAYSPASSPVPTVDGQMFGTQYQYPTAYFQPPTPVPSTTQGDVQSSANPEKPAAKADPAKATKNGVVPNGTAHSNSGTVPLASSHQNSSLTPDGTYRAPLLGGVPSAGYLDSTYGYDSTGAHFAWVPMWIVEYKIGMQNRRPTSTTGSAAPTYPNRMYTSPRPYTQYGNSMKTGLGYGSNGYDSRMYGRWGLGNGYYGYGNEIQQRMIVQYDAAKFFVIKSYSEDDIHKSIKYNVWASTTNGNKKLDAAYQEAQSKGSACPIFLFFSVNTSGQFVGVAQLTGAVDFEKTLEYWQQDKWNGSFSVKWHIVKDVPNNILKHIILENNENKPVTNSRDTQVTSILDDFTFYESRQKLMQEKRVKQQQIQKQVWDSRAPTSVAGEQKLEVVNGKPKISTPNGINGELKAPAENAAPVATYASKVAQSIAEKSVVANGVTTKTG